MRSISMRLILGIQRSEACGPSGTIVDLCFFETLESIEIVFFLSDSFVVFVIFVGLLKLPLTNDMLIV
jgi:hypothetical protein